MTDIEFSAPSKTRRSVVTAAAWSVPVIAAAIAAPAASASPGDVELGAFRIDAPCTTNANGNFLFSLTAGSAPLPVGTVIKFEAAEGALAISAAAWVYATATWLPGTEGALFTVVNAIPAGLTINLFWVRGELTGVYTATVILPGGYTGTGAKIMAIMDLGGGTCSAV